MNEERKPVDPGAYIGHEPERATETLPEGLGPEDERVSAVASRSTGVGGLDKRDQDPAPPSGHREGAPATDDEVRRAGENG
jgi:hypothetical protein